MLEVHLPCVFHSFVSEVRSVEVSDYLLKFICNIFVFCGANEANFSSTV